MRTVAGLVALSLAVACGPSLEDEEAEALGPEVGDPGPTHRPGQPCLVCHSERDSRGGVKFVVAGTIYELIDDPRGFAGAEVEITDAAGEVLVVHSNEAGNFMVSVDPGVAEPEEGEDGDLAVPAAPLFPLRVTVRSGAREQVMRNVIGREGSCAHCHTNPAGARSNGRVFLVTPP
jgi:hypothetical protein